MTDRPAQDDTDWQRECEVCGTELEQVQVDLTEAEFSEGKQGTPVMRDVCPNPECSRHQREYGAGATPAP